jgi:glycosyltransferase involved in cell wall biosynthesis
MNHKPLLTVSIAAYNVENYLEKTLNSLLVSEPLRDLLEVIVVNDGSKDNTITIAEKYTNMYPSVFKIIDKENGHYGSTINASLRVARGKYYRLLDGDDWYDTSSLEQFLHVLSIINSDCIITRYKTVNDETMEGKIVEDELLYDGIEKQFEDSGIGVGIAMHQITYKTDVLRTNGIRITEKCYYTDFEFILKPIPYIDTVTCIDSCVYMYRIGRDEQSVSTLSWYKNIDQAIQVTLNAANYYSLQSTKVNDGKRSIMKQMTLSSVFNKYKLLIGMPRKYCPKKRFVFFDKKMHDSDLDLYQSVVDVNRKYGILIKIVRMSHYMMFPVINSIVLCRKRIKE